MYSNANSTDVSAIHNPWNKGRLIGPKRGMIVPTVGSSRPSRCSGCCTTYLPAYTDRNGFWTLDGDAIRWLGVVLFAGGGVLRIWPVFVLGRRFSGLGAIPPGHTLVTSGVYGVIRHQLSGIARQLAGVGPRLSFGGRCPADGAPYPATPRAHPRGRAEERLLRRLAPSTMLTAPVADVNFTARVDHILAARHPRLLIGLDHFKAI